jgi:hypothetical protein
VEPNRPPDGAGVEPNKPPDGAGACPCVGVLEVGRFLTINILIC